MDFHIKIDDREKSRGSRLAEALKKEFQATFFHPKTSEILSKYKDVFKSFDVNVVRASAGDIKVLAGNRVIINLEYKTGSDVAESVYKRMESELSRMEPTIPIRGFAVETKNILRQTKDLPEYNGILNRLVRYQTRGFLGLYGTKEEDVFNRIVYLCRQTISNGINYMTAPLEPQVEFYGKGLNVNSPNLALLGYLISHKNMSKKRAEGVVKRYKNTSTMLKELEKLPTRDARVKELAKYINDPKSMIKLAGDVVDNLGFV